MSGIPRDGLPPDGVYREVSPGLLVPAEPVKRRTDWPGAIVACVFMLCLTAIALGFIL